MLSINTNLSSLIVQNSMKQSTNKLNQAIERMTTGFKINHAKDNAANYNIATNMTTQIGSLDVAEDNAMTSLDLLTTASDNLSLIQERVQRLRDLQEQVCNGTYGEQTLLAINAECNSLVDEINRLYLTTEYNGINLFLETTTNADGDAEILQEVYADSGTTFEELGITSSSFSVYDKNNNVLATYDIEGEDTIDDFFATLETHNFNPTIVSGKISIKSTDNSYIAGALADDLGITIELEDYVSSTTQGFISEQEVVNKTYNTITGNTSSTQTITTTTTIFETQTISTTKTETTVETITISTTTTTTTETYATTFVSQTETLLVNAGTSVDEAKRVANVSSFTSGETYYITNSADLVALQVFVNSGTDTTSITFELTSDIDMNGVNFRGIESFNGTFNGNGYTISNLTIDSTEGYVGLFGRLSSGARIENVGLENCNITGKNHVGGLVGYNLGGTVSNCYATGSVTADGSTVGGLVGYINGGTISNCYATGSVTGREDVGGLVGVSYGSISNCYATGSVTADGSNVGGLVGSNGDTISNCYATGSVTGDCNVGGLVGESNDTVNNCYAIGSVTGEEDVGGLVGLIDDGTVSNCYATGSVTGDCNIGGLVGESNGTVNNCYATGSVTGEEDVGGLVGLIDDGTVSNCYYNQEAYSQAIGSGTSTGVEAKSIAEIQALYSTMGFNTANGWTITNNSPHLSWESSTPTPINTSFVATRNSTLKQLGYTNDVSFVLPNSTRTFSIDTTIQELLDEILEDTAVTNAEFNNGIISVTTTNASLNLTSGFMSNFNATQTSSTTTTTNTTTTPIEYTTTSSNTTTVPWEYTTVKENYTTTTELVTTTSTTTQIETIFNTTTVALTGSNTFGNLGVTNLKVTVIGEGTRSVLSINENTTFDEFYAMLLTNNIETSQSGGTITFTGDGNTYVSSSALTNLFKLGALNKNISQRNVNTKSDAQIYTKNLLDELGPIYAPGSLTLQVGANADSNSQVGVTTAFSLVGYNDFRGIGVDGNNYLAQLDATLEVLNNRQVELGAMQNRLISALDEITVQRENLISSRSTLRDADISEVSSTYLRQQILQQASATLMSTANQSASIALSLI